jgi:hypothetical protein
MLARWPSDAKPLTARWHCADCSAQAVLQRHCAAFNGSCRIYAPKYQQARLGNYVVHGSDWGSADSWLSALVPIDMCALTKSDKPVCVCVPMHVPALAHAAQL